MQPLYAPQSTPPAASTPAAKGTPRALSSQGSPTTSQPVNDVVEVVRQKMENGDLNLQFSQHIALLDHCIERAKVEARKPQDTEKDLVIVIGNTGAGKSTPIIYHRDYRTARAHPESTGSFETEFKFKG